MDFKNVNLLNTRVNLISGNLLPIVSDNSGFPIIWRIYSAVVWIMEVIHVIAFIFGFILTPIEKSLKDGTVCIAIVVEASFMLTSLYSHKKLMDEMVQKMNAILQNADEIMNNIVKLTIKPIIMPFTIYAIVTVSSITMWTVQPVMLVFVKSTFFYTDYNLPTAFTTEPFSSGVLIPSTIFMTIASVYVFLKKFGVDMYMIHLVLMLTAQYRYTAEKLKILFRDLQDNDDKSQNEHLIKNQRTERELKKLCLHQTTVLHMSFILKKLLSVNFSLLYVNSVFRFCFVGLLLTTVPSLTFSEAISVLFYAGGSLTQFFLLCSSVQTLLDASTEITDKAFDEAWYKCESSMKRTFILLIMSNHLECKIAAIGKFNLSLPSFMTIINQSYSVALLFLRAN